MKRRFKEARLQKQMKVIEVAKLFEVAQSTVSAWETERKEPSIDRLAELYGVSIEYLLGYDSFEMLSKTEKIPTESIRLFHGKPVWVYGKGWALVNAERGEVIYADGCVDRIADNVELYFAPLAYTEANMRFDRPLLLDEIYTQTTVWVEPISQDQKLKDILRGTYIVKGEYVENTRGSRFHFDSYSATWIAFTAQTKKLLDT